MVPRAQRDHFFRKVSYHIYFSYPQIHDVFADDLFGVSHNDLRLQDVLRSVLAEQNVPKAEHRAELASTERSL